MSQSQKFKIFVSEETPPTSSGWVKAADIVPLESDGEVFVRFTDGSIGTGWATYWHGASTGFAQWTFPDPDEDRTVLEWAKNPAAPSQPVTLTDEEIDKVALEATGYDGFGTQPMNSHDLRNVAHGVIAALREKEKAK